MRVLGQSDSIKCLQVGFQFQQILLQGLEGYIFLCCVEIDTLGTKKHSWNSQAVIKNVSIADALIDTQFRCPVKLFPEQRTQRGQFFLIRR